MQLKGDIVPDVEWPTDQRNISILSKMENNSLTFDVY